jgi:3-oxoacyl-[acyl-carrier-protein] synthase III
MASLTIKGAAIRGIASAVPLNKQTTEDIAKVIGPDEAEKIAQGSGIRTRRVGRDGMCASDLCQAAAEELFKNMDWDRGSVDALIYVSQSFDYPMPATACILQHKLGLPKSCAAFDIELGCSGYIYGLWVASGLVSSGCRRIVLLAGEMGSRMPSPVDRTTLPLFGDCGSATAIEADGDSKMYFDLGTDGGGFKHLIIPAGTCTARLPHSAETMKLTDRGNGITRSEENIYMNGAEIFAFMIREVPPLIAAVLDHVQWKSEDVDHFVFHQANRFTLVHLAKKMNIPESKLALALEYYGNTSAGSVPLTITHCVREHLQKQKQKLVLAGFGAGLSWGGCALEAGPIVAPPLVEVP